MADYLHGAYGQINAVGNRVAGASQGAIVYIGTAPVHTIAGGAKNVNKPILISNMAAAREYFGYSDDWANYSLCEPMSVHLKTKGVGPLVLINVLDPEAHKATTHKSVSKTPSSGSFTITSAEYILVDSLEVATKVKGTDYTVAYDEDTKTITVTEKTAGSLGSDPLTVTYDEITVTTTSKTPSKGIIQIASAESIILDSIEVATKTKGTDYTVSYNIDAKIITIAETSSGSLGTSALSITYQSIDPTKVTNADVIGYSDGLGKNTGTYAVKDVYQLTGYIPSFIAAPGFSSDTLVHEALYGNSKKINGHWDAYMFVDLPLVSGGTAVTLDTAYTVKTSGGFTKENETVFFPIAAGVDGKKYHLSVLAAANFQELLMNQDAIPYRTASNTECSLIENLYLGEAYLDRIFDDELINKKLNQNGIASAVFVGGRWAIWGAHSADYDQSAATQINVSETNRMMLYYISNDFQVRRSRDVDKPMTMNDIKTIVSEEQARLDALKNMGAIIYGTVAMNASPSAKADILNGDWSFSFTVTTTPLAKSLTAIVAWTDDGFATYFEDAA